MASCYYDNQQFIVAMATRPAAVRISEVVGVCLGSAVESVGVTCATVGVACATRNNSIKNETIKN